MTRTTERAPMQANTHARRTILKAGAAGAGIAAIGGLSAMPAAASAMQTSPPGRLVVVFLRGGQDHLSAVVPFTDINYYNRRPTIAIPAAEVLPLDANFGFHPVMTGMHALYNANRLAVVVGAGNVAGDRSHFVAQDLWEYGDVATPTDGLGWLGRYLQNTASPDESIFRGITGGNNVNLSLRGYPALGIASIANFGLGGFSGQTSGQESLLRTMYYGNEIAEQTGTIALDAADQVNSLTAAIGTDDVSVVFADTAELLDADLGAEVTTLNIGKWDTHDGMGTWDDGEMRYLLQGLDGYLSTFQADLDARGLTDVTTVVMTEFGRRVDQNGTGGTDHGWGSAMFVLGAGVDGGQVVGSLPALTPANTPRNDVPVTTDCRDVLFEVAQSTLGVTNPTSIFPGHAASPVGVML